jgi:dephospho-CoA kinase
MLHLRKVAVAGGLSCGKSSVCRVLHQLGAYVISADAVVHQLLSSDTNLCREVVHLLGPTILRNKEIDRSQVGRIVFRNPELLSKLESLLHPAVYREMNSEYEKQLRSVEPPFLFIAEVPLLFESGGEVEFEKTVVVASDPELCCERFMKATGNDASEYWRRADRQMPIEKKIELADYVIYNNGTLEELRKQTEKIYLKLIH